MPRSRTAFLLVFLTISAQGCADEDPFLVSITDEPPATTSPNTGSSSTSTSTGDESTSTTDDPTTGTTTSEPSTSTTGDDTGPVEPMQCLDASVTCEASAASWCEEAHALAVAHLPKTYSDITAANCREGTEPCTLCFQIANTCTQVGTECDGLFELCGCLAQAHGEV